MQKPSGYGVFRADLAVNSLTFLVGFTTRKAMFSGIVEATAKVLSAVDAADLVRVQVEKPPHFNDLSTGDSVAVNGVCLTVEAFDQNQIQFALAKETLRVLRVSSSSLVGKTLNLERSLRFGDRIHGGLVSGHVDSMAQVLAVNVSENGADLKVLLDRNLAPFLWQKGTVALNGVALTVNEVIETTEGLIVSVYLIPETLKRTNLASLTPGEYVTVEGDYLAKLYSHQSKWNPLNKEQQS